MQATPYLGEIRIFAGTFAPTGWALCNGASFAISDNTALFSLISNIYGGDGVTTFSIPDLRGRMPVHPGTNATVGNDSTITLGQVDGAEEVTLTSAQMPYHTHTLYAQTEKATTSNPVANIFANTINPDTDYTTNAANTSLGGSSLSIAGANQPYELAGPSLPFTFIIALVGDYPSPSN